MPTTMKNGHIRKERSHYKKRKDINKIKVLKIISAVMEKKKSDSSGEKNIDGGDSKINNNNTNDINPPATSSSGSGKPGDDVHNEFFNTGRVGRRNALPDILLSSHCTTSTADLPDRLNALTTNDSKTANNCPGPSGLNTGNNTSTK